MNLIDDDLNQKLTKHSQKTLDMGRLHGGGGGGGGKYLCKNLGVEEGGGHLLEGGPIFGSLRYLLSVTVRPKPKNNVLSSAGLTTT